MGEQEVYGDEDISGLPNPPTGYGSKGVAKKDMTPEFGRPDNKNTSFNKQQLPYDTKFDFNEDDEEKPEGDEKSRLPGVDSDDEGNPIPAIEPDFDKMGMGIGSNWDKETCMFLKHAKRVLDLQSGASMLGPSKTNSNTRFVADAHRRSGLDDRSDCKCGWRRNHLNIEMGRNPV